MPAVLTLRLRGALWEDPEQGATAEQPRRLRDRGAVTAATLDGKGIQRAEQRRDRPQPKELDLGHVVNLATRDEAEDERIPDRGVVRSKDRRAALRDALRADDLHVVHAPEQPPEAAAVEEVVRVHPQLPGRARRSCTSRSARMRNAASQNAR